MNSLLGLVIFPWEQHFFDAIKTWKLKDLEARGRRRVSRSHLGQMGSLCGKIIEAVDQIVN